MNKLLLTGILAMSMMMSIKSMQEPSKKDPWTQEIIALSYMNAEEIGQALAENKLFEVKKFKHLPRPRNAAAFVTDLKQAVPIDKKLLKKLYRVYTHVDEDLARKLWHILNQVVIKYEVLHGTDKIATRLSEALSEDLHDRFRPLIESKVQKEEEQQQRRSQRALEEAAVLAQTKEK